MQDYARLGDFNDLVADYERYRIGYSSDLFEALGSFGMRRGAHVLDVGCGTGLSAQPLITRGLAVTGIDPSAPMVESAKRNVPKAEFLVGNVEQLPFPDRHFDGAVCAQAFHWFDADVAFAELIRVVKPGAAIGVWWKILGSDDPMRGLRAAAAEAAGVTPSADPLRGGFGAFYRAPFATRTLRVLPFMARFTVEDWLGYERSRASARNSYGGRREAYLAALRAELLAKFGTPEARLELRYTQYLYVGQTATS